MTFWKMFSSFVNFLKMTQLTVNHVNNSDIFTKLDLDIRVLYNDMRVRMNSCIY